MLSYETALKLKDAGFPELKGRYQSSKGYVFFSARNKDIENPQEFPPKEDVRTQTENKVGKIVFIPTLSELIEACGDKFTSLEKRPDGFRAISHENPRGYNFDSLIPFLSTVGSSPEEAVANLYLALNKK